MLRNAVSVTQADDVITDENNQPERKQYAGNGTMNNLTFHQQDPHSHITCTAFSIFFRISVLEGYHGQVGGTRFQVGMTGADQRRYLRPEE